LNPEIGPIVRFRVAQIYFDAIRALALKHNKTVSEYLRDEVVEPFLQAKAREATRPQFAAATVAQFIRDERNKLVSEIFKEVDVLVLEKLNVTGMLRERVTRKSYGRTARTRSLTRLCGGPMTRAAVVVTRCKLL
jgi:hypothetical protein